MAYSYIIQGDNVTIVIEGEPHTINKSHIVYDQVVNAIKAKDWDAVKELVNPTQVLTNYSNGNLQIIDGEMFWKGQAFHNALSTRMVSMLRDGFDIDPMVNFMNNLMYNPSRQAVTELYGFLEKNSLPITPDGCFLAYKRVRSDFKDCHTGTIDNSVGCVVEMERNMVDDNRNNTCSSGLHFCSYSYLQSFSGDRLVVVKIDPRDVVSIPSDYDNAKGRTCRYEVVGEVPNNVEDGKEFNKPVQSNANSLSYPMKTNSTPFYKGYTDGYNDDAFNPTMYDNWVDQRDYEEGWDKGQRHAEMNIPQKYDYVEFT